MQCYVKQKQDYVKQRQNYVKQMQNNVLLLTLAQNLVVLLDCIPDSWKTWKSWFLDQEILVSVFFPDQDHINLKSSVCVNFVRSVPNIHEVMCKKRFFQNLVIFADNLSPFLALRFQRSRLWGAVKIVWLDEI